MHHGHAHDHGQTPTPPPTRPAAGGLVARYATSHTHPVNRLCHSFGIPMIAASVPLFAASPFVSGLWRLPLALFTVGWVFQFVGHAFEGKPPEFLRDWRMLFVGVRWWVAKMRGLA